MGVGAGEEGAAGEEPVEGDDGMGVFFFLFLSLSFLFLGLGGGGKGKKG